MLFGMWSGETVTTGTVLQTSCTWKIGSGPLAAEGKLKGSVSNCRPRNKPAYLDWKKQLHSIPMFIHPNSPLFSKKLLRKVDLFQNLPTFKKNLYFKTRTKNISSAFEGQFFLFPVVFKSLLNFVLK